MGPRLKRRVSVCAIVAVLFVMWTSDAHAQTSRPGSGETLGQVYEHGAPPARHASAAPAPARTSAPRTSRAPGVSAGRLLEETLGFAVGSVISIGVGLAVLSSSYDSCATGASGAVDEALVCPVQAGSTALLLGGLAALFVAPLGTYTGGFIGHGRGGYGWTLLGYLGGSLVGGLLGLALAYTEDAGWQTVGGILFFAMQDAGASLAYELSSASAGPAPSAPTIAPTVAIGLDGRSALVGVRTAF